MRKHSLGLYVLCMALLVLLVSLSAPAQNSVLTQNADTERDAVYSNETLLTPTSTIHKLFTMSLDNPVMGQALVLGGVSVSGFPTNILYVTTSPNESAGTSSAWAFNADTGAELWKLSLGTNAAFNTAAPVLDPNLGPHGALFVVTKSSSSNTNELHAIDALAGTELPGSPVTITGTASGVTFNQGQENDRSALLDVNGTIYTSFCHMTDSGTYHGWLIGYKYTNGSGFSQNGVWCDTCAGGGNEGGIWQGGDGVAYDGTNIFVSTGNGSTGGGDFSMSIVQLSPSNLGTVLSSYLPPDAAGHSGSDLDLNGGGMVIMPGTGGKIFQGPSKYGSLYLVNGADLGAAAINTYSTNGSRGHSPIAWNSGTAQYAYVWASGSDLQQYCYSGGSTGSGPCETSSLSGGGPMAISGTGANAMLWAYGGTELHALNPTNVSAPDYWNSSMSAGDAPGGGPGGFQFFAIANGKVYISTGNSLIAYGTAGVVTPCTTVPTVPGDLAATAESSSQINLTWTASTAASGCSISYNVYESTTSGFVPSASNEIASDVTSTSFSATGLTASTTYYYLVEAADAAGSSGQSDQATATTTMASSGTCGVICINAGGPAVSPFAADEDFTGGETIDHANTINTANVTNPAPAAVYQDARVTTAAGSGSYTYTIGGLTAGTNYLVRLHFCETFWTAAGKREFNVSINGSQVLTDFDIFAAAGGQNIANIQQFTEAANASGQLVLVFTSVVDKALISGIEVDLGSAPRSCGTLCIDSGSTTGSTPFVPDEDFSGGNTIDHANTINTNNVTNPAPEEVYQSARDAVSAPAGGAAAGATFSYTIGGLTANSSHTVRLHFAETFFTAKGSRVFNVTINGTQVLTNFDIFAAAGGENIANIQQFTEAADATGTYTITFTSVTNNALISGIEID
jgi:Malectin domain/Fibronectin type III domain